MQKIQTFVGAENILTDNNFILMPDTGFYCIQMKAGGDCLTPGGNKGRTNKAKMDENIERILKRFFRAVEPDNMEVFGDDGFSWTRDLMDPAMDITPS